MVIYFLSQGRDKDNPGVNRSGAQCYGTYGAWRYLIYSATGIGTT